MISCERPVSSNSVPCTGATAVRPQFWMLLGWFGRGWGLDQGWGTEGFEMKPVEEGVEMKLVREGSGWNR